MLGQLRDPDKLVVRPRPHGDDDDGGERSARHHTKLAELVRLLVESVQAKGRIVEPESIVWTPPARPSFGPSALLWRRRTDSWAHQQRSVLDWYVEVG